MCDQRLKLWNTMASLARIRASWRGSLACSAAMRARLQRDLLAGDHDAALVRRLEQVDAAQERALAGAAGAQDGDHVALGAPDGDALEHLDLAELLLDALDGQGRRFLVDTEPPPRVILVAGNCARVAACCQAQPAVRHGKRRAPRPGGPAPTAAATGRAGARRPVARLRPRRSISRGSRPSTATPPATSTRSEAISRQPGSLVSASSRLATLTVSPIAVSAATGTMAHLAHDHRAEMQPQADAQAAHRARKRAPRSPDPAPRPSPAPRQDVARGLGGRGLHPEQGHHAVADELVDAAAGGLDRLAHGAEVPVQHEHPS